MICNIMKKVTYVASRLKSRGISYIFIHFREIILFDLVNSVKTRFVKYNSYSEETVHYVPCYTTTITKAIAKLDKLLGRTDAEIQFVDLGCGAGKVILLLSEYFNENQFHFTGIDYDDELCELANLNIVKRKRNSNNISIHNADAREVSKYLLNDLPVVLFLYNPFSDMILDQVLKTLNNIKL